MEFPVKPFTGNFVFETDIGQAMKRTITLILFLAAGCSVMGQSKTTLELEKRYSDSFKLFFYKNTLRMINQAENPEFDQLIENIEKMKFLMVKKDDKKFDNSEYEKLAMQYEKESFDRIFKSRIDGRNFDIYLRDSKGFKPGTVVLVNDSSNLYVLDIVGTFDVTKAGSLFKTLDSSTDIGSRIRRFTDQKDDTIPHRRRREKVN